MTGTISKHERNLGAIIHASTFSKYFIPFGNFILPLILWSANKKELSFVDHNGKQALNFQISLLLYSILLGVVTVPFFIGALPGILDFDNFNFNGFGIFNNMNFNFNHHNFNFSPFWWPIGVAGILQGGLFLMNLIYTILATIRTSEGEKFNYPFTIKFIK
ncbi:MAG: DUF4870 domain-containing protein [Cellulophaga sp.]